MFDVNEKMKKALQEYLFRTYSGEVLKEFVNGVERLNIWLELFLFYVI